MAVLNTFNNNTASINDAAKAIGKFAVVGAGIAGTTAALYLADQGFVVDLFEKNKEIFSESSKLPVHLYSGVQYFHEISTDSIQRCMLQAIIWARTMPFSVKIRPTVVAIQKSDIRSPLDLEKACKMNQEYYKLKCEEDSANQVFGDPSQFYKTYSRNDLEYLKAQVSISSDDSKWMKAFAAHTNLDELQYPVFLIREYGLDMRSSAKNIGEMLLRHPQIRLHTCKTIEKVTLGSDGIFLNGISKEECFEEKYNAVIDASGRNLGKLEEQLGIDRLRQTDIKMAGLFKLSKNYHGIDDKLPEIYILGGKGHQEGFMSHLSPIDSDEGQDRFFLVNVTTENCTYIKDGKRSNKGRGVVSVNAENCPIANQVLSDESSHSPRLLNMISMIAKRHKVISENLEPVCGMAGSVEILGDNLQARDNKIDAHPDKRFISLNITKGSAAAMVAAELINELQRNSSSYQINMQKPVVETDSD